MRAECVADIIMPNSFIALFSSPESFKLFICVSCFPWNQPLKSWLINRTMLLNKVISVLYATILKIWRRNKGICIKYKNHSKTAFVLPMQMLCPLVNLDKNLSMFATDYQWLSDSIWWNFTRKSFILQYNSVSVSIWTLDISLNFFQPLLLHSFPVQIF